MYAQLKPMFRVRHYIFHDDPINRCRPRRHRFDLTPACPSSTYQRIFITAVGLVCSFQRQCLLDVKDARKRGKKSVRQVGDDFSRSAGSPLGAPSPLSEYNRPPLLSTNFAVRQLARARLSRSTTRSRQVFSYKPLPSAAHHSCGSRRRPSSPRCADGRRPGSSGRTWPWRRRGS